ncbi:uncharacterized protein LOC123525213 [Mercenaria mercenaria]|uniref:uncharacterized protein LOC123525213 n=1 Tax=Mercenaria mercenaria TaxID=6596 RepID=UPI001E1DF985|nr:uncharacterized protein LOC123525213 [Mercenaria mercenaria]XP_045160016.1 uncharacterized protein LOC123525213 [Mercenaria mercenaria]
MSKFKLIGPSGRCCLRKTSPYATLLLDISSGLTGEDISNFKLVIQADKRATRRQMYQLKHGADVLAFLDDRKMITNTCTDFLQHLLIKIGRKDLERRVQKYNDDRRKTHYDEENTVRKQVFTQLKSTCSDQLQKEMKWLSIQTAVKEVYDSTTRSIPDGASRSSSLVESSTIHACQDNTELSLSQTLSSSPMSVDSSQENRSQGNSSQGNCTDEEKIGQLSDKVWLYETETDAVMASQ